MIELGFYRHYKTTDESPMIYEVLGVAKHSETDELLVVYRPTYDSGWIKPATLVVRPYEMFVGELEWNGRTVKRFTFIGETKNN
jgi:hypothetical protein